jgi:large subunit ribosomal protein L22
VAKWVRISPRKARLVVDNIRGRSVPEARTVLAFTDRDAAREVEKVLRSAVANAEANHGLIGDELLVSAAHVDDGLIIKRWRPQARGRIAPIKKRTCHITIKVAPQGGGVIPEPRVPEPPPVVEETPEPEAEAAAEEAPKADSEGAPTPEEQTAPKAEKPKAEKPKRRAPRRKKKEESEE